MIRDLQISTADYLISDTVSDNEDYSFALDIHEIFMNISEILDNCATVCSKNSCTCLINLSTSVVEKYAKNHRKKIIMSEFMAEILHIYF